MNTAKCKNVNILGVRFDLIAYNVVMETIDRWKRNGERHYLVMSNPHSVMICQRDLEMRNATENANMTLPDGIGIILATKLLGFPHTGRVTGPELMLKLCDWGRKYRYRHYFYGGAKGVAKRLAEHLCLIYPGLEVAGTYSPPFRPFAQEEDREIVEEINSTKPDVVWIGLGAPKQEKWMAIHQGRIDATAMIGTGAAFDFHSGNVKRGPTWVVKIGMEWAYRLAQDPKRMWRRNLESPVFLAKVIRQRLMMMLSHDISNSKSSCSEDPPSTNP